MNEAQERYRKCFYHEIGNMEQVRQGHIHFCVPKEAKTIGDRWKMKKEIDPAQCENCKRYKSRFIEYPLTIEGIEVNMPEPWGVELKPVRIRPCNGTKTYFGIYLGEFPRYAGVTFDNETKKLRVSPSCNPCIYVPALEKAVFGDESWWSEIEPGEDIKDITDECIQNQWYMKMLCDAKEDVYQK